MKKLLIGLLAGTCVASGIVYSLLATTATAEDLLVEVATEPVASEEVAYERPLYQLDSGETIPLNRPIACGYSAMSFREIAEEADVIVLGEPTESIEESESFPELGYNAFSVTNFKIEKVLKGSFKDGDTLRFAQGATIMSNSDFEFPDNVEFSPEVEFSKEKYLYISTAESYRPVRKGAKYILFLNPGLGDATDAYFPASMEGGRYNVDGTDRLAYLTSEHEKMSDYAIALYEAILENPNANPLAEIVERSDKDFAALVEK